MVRLSMASFEYQIRFLLADLVADSKMHWGLTGMHERASKSRNETLRRSMVWRSCLATIDGATVCLRSRPFMPSVLKVWLAPRRARSRVSHRASARPGYESRRPTG
jgi:hypothetical protein